MELWEHLEFLLLLMSMYIELCDFSFILTVCSILFD
jgi:hypothetical protein